MKIDLIKNWMSSNIQGGLSTLDETFQTRYNQDHTDAVSEQAEAPSDCGTTAIISNC